MRRLGAPACTGLVPTRCSCCGIVLFCICFSNKRGRKDKRREKNRETGRGKISPFQTLCSAAADQTDIFPANHAGGRQPLADSHRPVLAARMKVGHERVWPHNAKRSIFPKENIPGLVTRRADGSLVLCAVK